MPVRLSDLPPHLRRQIQARAQEAQAENMPADIPPRRAKPSRSEDGKPTVGRCIPHTGTCTWTGPYGAAFERHTRQTGHGRLELLDTEDHTDG